MQFSNQALAVITSSLAKVRLWSYMSHFAYRVQNAVPAQPCVGKLGNISGSTELFAL